MVCCYIYGQFYDNIFVIILSSLSFISFLICLYFLLQEKVALLIRSRRHKEDLNRQCRAECQEETQPARVSLDYSGDKGTVDVRQ